MRQLLYRQREGLAAAENGIGGQEHDRPGELRVALRFEIPGFHGREVILAGADLRPPVEGNAPAVAKPIDNCDRDAVLAAGIVADIDDEAVQILEVTANLVQSRSQLPLLDVFQLKDAHVAEFRRPAIVKHPGLGLHRPAETIGEESLLGGLEELLDLLLREFRGESGFFLGGKYAFFRKPLRSGLQLDMSVIQRVEHLAENIEEFLVGGPAGDLGAVGVILLFPVDIPQLEKWIPVVKGLPQLFEILFRVAIRHGRVDPGSATPKSW
jgi:hypothetical protein